MPTLDPKKKERVAELVGLGGTPPEAAQAVGVHAPCSCVSALGTLAVLARVYGLV